MACSTTVRVGGCTLRSTSVPRNHPGSWTGRGSMRASRGFVPWRAVRKTRSTTPRATCGSTRGWWPRPWLACRAGGPCRKTNDRSSSLPPCCTTSPSRPAPARTRTAGSPPGAIRGAVPSWHGSSSGGWACRSPSASRSRRWSVITRFPTTWWTAPTPGGWPLKSVRRPAATGLPSWPRPTSGAALARTGSACWTTSPCSSSSVRRRAACLPPARLRRTTRDSSISAARSVTPTRRPTRTFVPRSC